MEQKVVIINGEDSNLVNVYLNEGWKIKSVTPQHVSTGGGSQIKGGFCFVLERY
jgi:hypothetical protein